MCRLVAYQGPARSPDELVFGGEHSLVVQSYRPRELLSGSVNGDGFGVVWYRDGIPVRTASAFPIWHDPDLQGLLGSVESRTVVAALRNVTPGLPVSESAIPPVTVDRWSFVLNGFIEEFRPRFMRRIHAAIPDDLFGRLTGVSDTEALALLAVAECRAGAPPGRALERVVRAMVDLVVADGASAQLNMVLADGKELAACRASSGPVPNSLYLLESRETPGATLASEPLTDPRAWSPVPPQSVVEVREGVPAVRPL